MADRLELSLELADPSFSLTVGEEGPEGEKALTKRMLNKRGENIIFGVFFEDSGSPPDESSIYVQHPDPNSLDILLPTSYFMKRSIVARRSLLEVAQTNFIEQHEYISPDRYAILTSAHDCTLRSQEGIEVHRKNVFIVSGLIPEGEDGSEIGNPSSLVPYQEILNLDRNAYQSQNDPSLIDFMAPLKRAVAVQTIETWQQSIDQYEERMV